MVVQNLKAHFQLGATVVNCPECGRLYSNQRPKNGDVAKCSVCGVGFTMVLDRRKEERRIEEKRENQKHIRHASGLS